MDKKVYARAMAGQYWYNFTEALAYALLYRPTPKELVYEPRVRYGKDKDEYINIYYPKDAANKKKPLFIYVHGGGWISGINDMRNNYISNWAKLGFLTASINYTPAPQKVYPAQIGEIFKGIDYLFDNAEKYNIDTDNIVVAGESAGGYFVSYLASVAADKTLPQKLGLEFRHCEEFNINAIVTHSGCFNLKRLLDPQKEQSKFPDVKMMVRSYLGRRRNEVVQWLDSEEAKYVSPVVTKDFPPAFVTWTAADKLRFDSFDFIKELEQNGVPHAQFKGDGIISQHAWTIVTVFEKGRICFEKTKEFVLPYLPEYF